MMERELVDVDGRRRGEAGQPVMAVTGVEEDPDHRTGKARVDAE